MADGSRAPWTDRGTPSNNENRHDTPLQYIFARHRVPNRQNNTPQAIPSPAEPPATARPAREPRDMTTRFPTRESLMRVIPEWHENWNHDNDFVSNAPPIDAGAAMAAPPPQQADPADGNGSLQEMVSDPSLDSTEDADAYAFDTTDPSLHHLREISPLATWTVSTSKPHCGAPSLLHPSPATFWQSDGPQPHLLTAHFPRTVSIVKLRIYLDFSLDESYTPTRMEFWGGVHGAGYGLVQFAEWRGEEPRGWQEVELGLGGGGGGEGEKGVRVRVLQVRVAENHQNGKDTHVRGVQVFARDERGGRGGGLEGGGGGGGAVVDAGVGGGGRRKRGREKGFEREYVGEEPDWMGEPEVR